jgi:hypothetical protein
VKSGVAQRVSIVRGDETEGGIEVTRGLKDGEVVVIAPSPNLSEGQKVQATQ